jgi:ABC-2 type transport system permease protein
MPAELEMNAAPSEGVTSSERERLRGGAAAPVRTGAGAGALLAITQRELTSLFYSPIAYVVGFVFLLLTGYAFVTDTMVIGQDATMRPLFVQMAAVLVFALPLLTMRSIAEEFATGAIEALMTAPVGDGTVITGKFFGSMLFYVALLATTLLHVVLMFAFASPSAPDLPQVMVGYLGLILLGSLFVSIGIFASSCTRHQLLAAVLGIAILAVITFVADYGAEFAASQKAKFVCAYINAFGHFQDFAKGIVDTGSLIYFVSGTAFFLFLATKMQESRRWR